MPFTLHYHPAVRDEDLPLIDRKSKDRTRKAIEERLQTVSQDYGEPLRKSLKATGNSGWVIFSNNCDRVWPMY